MKKSSIMGISFQRYREKEKSCSICGGKVHGDENYTVSKEGYCHRGCVYSNKGLTKRINLKIKNQAKEVKKFK